MNINPIKKAALLFFFPLVILSCKDCECDDVVKWADLVIDVFNVVQDNVDADTPFLLETSVLNELLECGNDEESTADPTIRRYTIQYRPTSDDPFSQIEINTPNGTVEFLDIGVPTLANGSRTGAQQDQFSFDDPGEYAFNQSVDPSDIVRERNENNNVADPSSGNLSGKSFGKTLVITVNPSEHDRRDPSTLKGSITYLGTIDAE